MGRGAVTLFEGQSKMRNLAVIGHKTVIAVAAIVMIGKEEHRVVEAPERCLLSHSHHCTGHSMAVTAG